jgi:CRISPR-associated protein Csy1
MMADRVEQDFHAAVNLLRAGQALAAERALRKIVARHASHAGASYYLGVIAHQGGRLEEARRALVRACRLDARQPVYPYTLGLVLHDLHDAAAAEASYREAIRRHPVFAEAWNNLGLVLLDSKRLDEAAQVLREALRLKPGYAAATRNLVTTLIAQGKGLAERNQAAEARACFQQALAIEPDKLAATLGAALTLPVVYASLAAVTEERTRYAAGLDALHAALPRLLSLPRAQVLDELQHCNFYLAYQGENDLPLQTRYGDFVSALLQAAVPDLMQPLAPRSREGRRVRVGFVSSFFRHCTAGLYFKSWITGLDRAQFETHVYHLGPTTDFLTEGIRVASDFFVRPEGTIEELAQAVRRDELDVLIYPEAGMDGRTFLLAALRLAPLQCVGWGHPVTTGLSSVDVFLSSAAMEPAAAAAHYRERLLPLPGLGTCYPRPVVGGGKTRTDFGLPEGKTLYLFPQSPFKVHPDNDAVLARVLDNDADGILVLFEGPRQEMTAALVERLVAAAVPRERLVVLPAMAHDDYLQVNALCDVMLDSMRWSGGNTALDALACGLPLVTLPGELMRGRQSAGMLRLLGVDELIAADGDDYVAIATRLGREPSWRDELSARIRDGLGQLFDDAEPVHALERALLDLVREQ